MAKNLSLLHTFTESVSNIECQIKKVVKQIGRVNRLNPAGIESVASEVQDSIVEPIENKVTPVSPVLDSAVVGNKPIREDGSQPYFADLAKVCTADDFQVVVNRRGARRNAKKLVVGSSRDANVFQGVAKKAVLCVNRLASGTTTDSVSDYLKSKGVTVYSCYEIVPKHSSEPQERFIGMRVCISHSDIQTVFSDDLWPTGVTVRPWLFKKR